MLRRTTDTSLEKGDPLLLYIHLTWWQFLPRTKCHTHRFAVRRDGMRKFKNIKTWNCDYCLHLQPNEIFLFFKATFKKSRSVYMFFQHFKCAFLQESLTLNSRGTRLSYLISCVDVLTLLLYMHMALVCTWLEQNVWFWFVRFAPRNNNMGKSPELSCVRSRSCIIVVNKVSFSPGSSLSIFLQHPWVTSSLAMYLGKVSVMLSSVTIDVFL